MFTAIELQVLRAARVAALVKAAGCPCCDGDAEIFSCTCMPSTIPAPSTGTAVDSQGELDDESEPAWVIEAGTVVA